MERIPDPILIERLPSDEAIQALYDRYGRMVYSVAMGILKDADLADDATQSVFLILLGKAHELRRHGTLAGWLYVTAARTARAHRRSELARKAREMAYVTASVPANRLDRPDVTAALDRLHPTDREALLLRFVAQCTFEEIGGRLNVSANAARMRVDRSLSKLRERLAGADAAAWLIVSLGHQPKSATVNRGVAFKLKPLGPVNSFRGAIQTMIPTKYLALCLIPPLALGGFFALRPPTQSPKGSTVPAHSGVDANEQPTWSDLAFASQSYTNGTPYTLDARPQAASFSEPIADMVGIGGKRLELVLIPKGQPGAYSCDVKATICDDPDGDEWTTLRQKMDAPTLGNYKWQPGQTVFISLSPPPNATFHVYNSEAEIPNSDRKIYFRVKFNVKPGAREDPNFWKSHIISGRDDEDIIDARPVSVDLDLRFTQDGKELGHQTLHAANDKVGTFVVHRPDGIRSEISFVPEMLGTGSFVQWKWTEFREVHKPGQRDPRSGHGSLGGEGSGFQPYVNLTQKLSLDDNYDGQTHLECSVRVISVTLPGKA